VEFINPSALQVPMSSMPDMTPTSLATVIAPRTGKIIKNDHVFEREHLLQNGILRFVFKSEIVLQS